MDSYFSDLLCLLNNGQNSDLFATHFEHHFNSTTSHTDLRKHMSFKLVKQINPINAINIWNTKVQPMNGVTLNNPLKAMW